MIKTLTNLFKQDKEKFVVPKGVQDVIPVAAIFDDGIFKVGRRQGKSLYTGGTVLLRICSVFYGGYQAEVSGVLQGFDPA